MHFTRSILAWKIASVKYVRYWLTLRKQLITIIQYRHVGQAVNGRDDWTVRNYSPPLQIIKQPQNMLEYLMVAEDEKT